MQTLQIAKRWRRRIGYALTDSEKAEIVRFESAIAAAARKRQMELDEKLADAIAQLNDRAAKLEKSELDGEAVAMLRHDFASLMEVHSGATQSVKVEARPLQARIDALVKKSGLQEKTREALKSITTRIGDPDGFQMALADYAAKFPDTPRSTDFKRLDGEVADWNSGQAWDHFLASEQRDPTHLDPAAANAYLAVCNELLKSHGDFPLASGLKARLTYVESVSRRHKDGSSLIAPLNEFLTDPLIKGLWMVETADDDKISRYYLKAEPRDIGDKTDELRLSYIFDFSTASVRRTIVLTKTIDYNGPAPQSTVAKRLMDELAALDHRSWEGTFFNALQEIVNQERMEPILKVLFLRKVVGVGRSGSDVLQKTLTSYQHVLDSVPINPASPWMDPTNMNADKDRAEAADLLQRLPDLRPLMTAAAERVKALKPLLGPRYRWVGWLMRHDDGAWACLTRTPLKGEGKLLVLLREGEAKQLHWSEIGLVKSGAVILGAFNAITFVEGRPIYFVPHTTTP